jgi:murein L,D-transpeptidase YcbB/YkuD
VVGSWLVVLIAAGLSATEDDLSIAIEERLSGPILPQVRQFRDFELLFGEISAFYDRRDFQPAWIENRRLSGSARRVLSVLGSAEEHGLRSGDYLAGPLATDGALISSSTDTEALAAIDLSISAQTMRYIKDLHSGRFTPREVKLGLDIRHKELDLAYELDRLLQVSDVQALLASFAPQHSGYERLKEQLAYYRKLAAEDDWQRLDESRVLEEGDDYPQADRLRQRLVQTGDLPRTSTTGGPIYDPELASAVARFQTRHGLGADAIIGEKTFRQLNRPWNDRVAQIAVSLERWRWVPDDTEDRLVVVNVPSFFLRAFDDVHRPELSAVDSRVVVGKTYNRFRTPIFNGLLEYLDFRPYWNIPGSIVRREIAPHLDEPGYLDQHDYEIVREFGHNAQVLPVTPENLEKVKQGALLLRQRPGPKNALGEVKFIFPNEHNVYLHSTPAKTLFARSKRDFSHGCIRVADPVGLSEWLLSDQPGWDRQAIEQAMGKGAPTRVSITQRTPVWILYVTSLVDAKTGDLYFWDDIYGLDEALAEALGHDLRSLLASN